MYKRQAVEREKREIFIDTARLEFGAPRVSRLFSTFTNLISVTQQEMVNIIVNNRQDADLALVVRAELFAQLHSDGFKNPGLVDLFHRGILKECGEALNLARGMNDPLFRPAEQANPKSELNELTPEAQEARRLLESRNQDYRERFERLASRPDRNMSFEAAKMIAATIEGTCLLYTSPSPRD